MKRAAVSLSVLVLLLFAWTRSLAERVPSAEGFVQLVDDERKAQLEVAGVSVEFVGTKERYLYVMTGGVWRCTSAFGALAISQHIEEFSTELLEAVGQPRSADPARAADYGFGDDTRISVRFHGPGLGEEQAEDVVLGFDLGRSLAGTGGGRSWVRLHGNDMIYEIQFDPRARLSRSGKSPLPPLLDERLLAGEWPPRGGGLTRVFLDYSDGRSLQLDSELHEAPGLPREEWPREWNATAGTARARCMPFRMAGWQAFLYRAPYAGFSDPAAAERRGLDEPQATLTLLQVDADPITLVVGRAAPSGAVFVLNEKTGLLCLLESQVAELLLPSIEQLCEPAGGNPWESWLPR